MPKKTKKEKILAEYRRKLKQLKTQETSFSKNIQYYPEEINNSLKMEEKRENVSLSPVVYLEKNANEKNLVSLIKRDLKKTFIIAFLILSLEFLFFYAIF